MVQQRWQWLVKAWLLSSILVTTVRAESIAPVYTVIHSFRHNDGSNSHAGLVQAEDGWLWGTTTAGGDYDAGTIFKTSLVGNLVTLHSFQGRDGSNPGSSLALATDGNFYGTTPTGGAFNYYGTVFDLTPQGVLTTLHSFDAEAGFTPSAGLLEAQDGNFYGTTTYGQGTAGTAFRVDARGLLTTLHSFTGEDGTYPGSRLVEVDGYFYGTTASGGIEVPQVCDYGCGTVFRLSPVGTLTTLYRFSGGDGAGPEGLLLGEDGFLYGVTAGGGAASSGTVYRLDPASATLTTLYAFGGDDGAYPHAALAQGQDGNLYGTTTFGGFYDKNLCLGGCGTVFRLTTGGEQTVLHRFVGRDGAYPYSQLMQGADGHLYGTTSFGGPVPSACFQGCGVVFQLDLGSNSFVPAITQFTPAMGRVGETVTVVGEHFTGATKVTFHGITASFTVQSDTALTAQVPPGLKGGRIRVTTPNGKTTSARKFYLLPPRP
ncbi:choice-of-anchor tandem repeat GloVer-containing protein [Candidatus Cyanaurora vandensis]|uniref:choice-of-anchor tandem repeat GloVer-containing protein n=1 Tax=Candidatus Cyanaurora vandensis TaxID=2714958 RepID=UPI00257B95C8|nr:choice-of-anchor tandem repeat GloVer-containing protein [Candidatus Cyanaurora vandensis]